MPIQIPNDLPAAGTLQQENIFGMIDHNTHFRFPHFSILYLSFFQQYKFIICFTKSQNILLFVLVKFTTCFL